MAVHGKGTVVLMDGWLMSDVLNSIETPATVDTAESTVFNSSGSKSYVTGVADATLTAEGFFVSSSSDSSVEDTLHSALPTSSLNVWTWWPEGTSTGKFGFGLTSIETGYTITNPVDGTIDISVDGQVSDGRDSIESLRRLSCGATSTGNGASDDNTVATTNGGIGYYQRTTNSTNDFLVAIQHSAVGTTWDNLIAFSSGTGRTGERIAVAGTVKRFTREVHTTTGVLGTAINFSVGFKRKVR
jgi:hypothetical protein